MNKTSVLYSLAELGPLLAFFIAGQLTDFYTAVAILMATTVLAVALSWYGAQHVPWLPIISAVIVLIGGAVTLLYENPDAVIFADTVYYSLIALGLFIALKYKKLVLKNMFYAVFAISDTGWRAVTWRWIIFLTIAAIANEFARALLPPESWIDYRFYKSIVIVLFALTQFQLSRKYRIPEESNAWGLRK